MNYNAVIASPFSKLGICIVEKKVSRLFFLDDEVPLSKPKGTLLSLIVKELNLYFQNAVFHPYIPYRAEGTPFQQLVWREIANLDPGETMQYGQLARKLNTSPRAVGNACRANPVPILIPCHRVLAKKGWGGYKGKKFISIKKWLLNHEKSID